MTEYRKVFVDTAPLIYLLERSTLYHDRVRRLFENWFNTATEVITSVITVEEYCVFPYRQNNAELIDKFERFIQAFGIALCPIDVRTAQKASWIRGNYPAFKAMDALQLSVAELQGCDCFLTNDKQLRQYTHLNCIVIDDIKP